MMDFLHDRKVICDGNVQSTKEVPVDISGQQVIAAVSYTFTIILVSGIYTSVTSASSRSDRISNMSYVTNII